MNPPTGSDWLVGIGALVVAALLWYWLTLAIGPWWLW